MSVRILDRSCARVRTKAGALSPEVEAQLREIDAQIDRANTQKEEAVAAQEYARGAEFRDQADALGKEKERLRRERPDRSVEEAVVDASVVAEVARDLANQSPPAGPGPE